MNKVLKEKVKRAIMRQFEIVPAQEGIFYFNKIWYMTKWGCDTLDHIIDAIDAIDMEGPDA